MATRISLALALENANSILKGHQNALGEDIPRYGAMPDQARPSGWGMSGSITTVRGRVQYDRSRGLFQGGQVRLGACALSRSASQLVSLPV